MMLADRQRLPVTKLLLGVQAMKAAEAGLYCGPLRLLAMEVYDALNAEGTPCNLVTGQERTVLPGASHMSCTVEMTSMSQRFDVAVLDEIQVRGGCMQRMCRLKCKPCRWSAWSHW